MLLRERDGLARELLDEAEAGPASVLPRPDLELVRDRADDRDPEAALAQTVLAPLAPTRIETAALVRDDDRESVLGKRVRDLDVPLRVRVRVPDRVRARLRERKLEVGERLVAERPQTRQTGQGKPTEGDVLRLRGDGQPYDWVRAVTPRHSRTFTTLSPHGPLRRRGARAPGLARGRQLPPPGRGKHAASKRCESAAARRRRPLGKPDGDQDLVAAPLDAEARRLARRERIRDDARDVAGLRD